MKRRTVLAGAGGMLGLPLVRRVRGDTGPNPSAPERADEASWNGTRTTKPLLQGTKYETAIVTIDSGNNGPTAFVTGGIHGDERCGYLAAERVSNWQFDTGRVVVVPRVNKPAIRKDQRKGVGGDLNRQFPPGETPTTRLARALWSLIEDVNPDVVVNCHRSTGIYNLQRGSVGQAIFPTAGAGVRNANKTIQYMNDQYVPWYMPFHNYRRGDVQNMNVPLLTDKLAADTDATGYIVETTNYLVDLHTQTKWESAIVAHLLSLHGIKRIDGQSNAGQSGSNGRGTTNRGNA